ncbi:type II toxin-antitoxin system YafQ family toxin [Actinomyces sp. Marseille-QA0893]
MLKLKLLCVKLVKLLPDVSLLVAICRHRRRSLMSMMSDSQQGRRSLVMTSQFKKDLKRARKRGLPIGELEAVIDAILEGADLSPRHRDHLLSGDYAGFRECHIQPDWLLIYLDEPELCVVTAIRTGSHSDLF